MRNSANFAIMTAKVVTATEAARRLGDLLARVRYRDERFLIKRGKAIVAQLGPPPFTGCTGLEAADRWRRRAALPAAEAAAFERDVTRARDRANVPPRDPWRR